MTKTNKLPFFLGIAAVVAVFCLIAALGLLYFMLNMPDNSSPGMMNRSAPDFELSSLNGHQLSLEQLRGKPLLINFWATWCDPCIAELPLLEATAQLHGDDLVVIGVNEGESLSTVEGFLKVHQLSYSILLDYDETVGNLYRINGYPTSVFIDRDGIVRAIYLGEIPVDQLERNLRLIGIQ